MICVYVTPKCANYAGSHVTNSSSYVLKDKAEINARKKKKIKASQKEKVQACSINNEVKEERKKASAQLD